MAKHKNSGRSVAEILKEKRANIKEAALDPGSPSWDDILELSWEEIVRGAKERQPGFQTFKKLLSKGEYNK